MKNVVTLILIAVIVGFSIRKGLALQERMPVSSPAAPSRQSAVPSIGRLQVLNGCGSGGSARIMAEYLRTKHFDVKNIGNADNWNFTETLVISRIVDTSIALQVATALGTKNMVLIRTPETLYDVTVIVGPDYRERLQ
ncbi:MAG: LytR C-terminal domain-containing protein [Chitinispirillaceae bacterium]|nr:LytR C-terminal domain-containing protein [Chitinispirillaceae bacterium]